MRGIPLKLYISSVLMLTTAGGIDAGIAQALVIAGVGTLVLAIAWLVAESPSDDDDKDTCDYRH